MSNVVPPRRPALLEINTRVWLSKLSYDSGRRVTLADIDNPILDEFVRRGIDWVWLLGVWETGPASRAEALRDSTLRTEFSAAVPDLRDDDIAGSDFAIGAYAVDAALGGDEALADLRARLAERGIRLMLDFVPNHTGLDHAWAKSHPDYYVQGSDALIAASPANYVKVETDRGSRYLAHGRDPNFPAWTDTLQLNYANPAVHATQIETLAAIADRCDGVRCDMAMLLLPEIFARSWDVSAPSFWPKAIAETRRTHRGFTFLAEAYWDLEWTLLQQGFDYCYDKRLYDRLLHGNAASIRAHLSAGLEYQSRLVRFLENHDEPRAARAFSWAQHQAAAIVTYFAPGLCFFHQGQWEGAQIRVPIQLRRAAREAPDRQIEDFYQRLTALLQRHRAFPQRDWALMSPEAESIGDSTVDQFIAFAWRESPEALCLAVVNYAAGAGRCLLRLPLSESNNAHLRLTDEIGSAAPGHDAARLGEQGLQLILGPWGYRVLRIERMV